MKAYYALYLQLGKVVHFESDTIDSGIEPKTFKQPTSDLKVLQTKTVLRRR